MSRLDPRDPLVLDTHAVARRPGAMVEVDRTVPAPPGLGTDVVGVPEGAPIELQLRLESVVEGVLVSGICRAQASGECVRCLDPVGVELDLDVQELFAYPDAAAAEAEEITQVEDELVDFRPVLRDAVVLALPAATGVPGRLSRPLRHVRRPADRRPGAPARPGRPAMGRPGGPAPAGL